MAGTPERLDPEYRRFVLIGCALPLLAVLIGGTSLVIHYSIKTPTSPYQVEFREPGRGCDEEDDKSKDAALILDRDTGEVLYCGLIPRYDFDNTPDPRGPFSAEEVGRVTQLSKRLGSDGHLSDADRDAVKGLVAQIGREHGHHKASPTRMEQVTWILGLSGIIAGVVMLLALGLWAHYTGQ